ncbi:MAG: hypothetical protein LBH65_02820 [Desulfovibrio sp.]|nr:hypothetical protein [Desulfovibrio sp.]
MAHMQTTQTINAFTASEAEAIRSEILLAAQNIIGTIKTESATIVRAIVGLKESNAAIIKGQAAASEAMKTEDMYGKASQPSGLCGASSVGAGLQLSAQAATEVRGAMRDRQREYSSRAGARPVEFLDRIMSDEHPDAGAMTDSLYPLKDTLTEDQVAEAHESITTLTNPRPLPVVTDAQRETPAGQTYAAARLIHEGRLAVVTETLNSHVVSHAPTLPDEVASWAQNQWSEAGGSGTPPGLVDGKLSEAGLYKLLTQMRLGNPNWFVQVTSATEAGLLRELVMMQALQLELTRKNNELLDRLAVTASLDFLTRMEGTDGKSMTDLYTRMVGAQQ